MAGQGGRNLDDWKDQSMQDELFRMHAKEQSDALELLKHTAVNSCRTAEAARCELVGSRQMRHLGLKYDDFYEKFTVLQLSIGKPENSRVQFLAALKASAVIKAEEEKKGWLSGILGGDK